MSRSIWSQNPNEAFPDPFDDIASKHISRNWRNVLEWCQTMYTTNGLYSRALQNAVSYFLTSVHVEDVDDEKTEQYREYFTEHLDSLTSLRKLFNDKDCYGNGFASLLIPFQRILSCKTCGFQLTIRHWYDYAPSQFHHHGSTFTVTCPRCKARGPARVDDKTSTDYREYRIKHWSPLEMEIRHDLFTDDVIYRWRIPETYRHDLSRHGRDAIWHLERQPLEVLDAIHTNSLYEFHPGVIFHAKDPSVSGLQLRGWGVPRVFCNYRQLYYVQVLRRFNEAIGIDYVIPIRLITPAPRTAGQTFSDGVDPSELVDPITMKSHFNRIMRNRRQNPTGWEFMPFPVEYRVLGGDANQLAPSELINRANEDLLLETGMPVELWKGSLQFQAAPVALRLFQANHSHIPFQANKFLMFVMEQSHLALNWDRCKASLRRVDLADDIEKHQLALALMPQGFIAPSTVVNSLGHNFRQEVRRALEDQQEVAELTKEKQEEMEKTEMASQVFGPSVMQQMMAGGQPGQPGQPAPSGPASAGAPPPGGGDPAMTGAAGPTGATQPGVTGYPVTDYIASAGPGEEIPYDEMEQVSTELSDALLAIPNTAVRRRELRMLQEQKPMLHKIVRTKMDQTRQQQGTEARHQVYGS